MEYVQKLQGNHLPFPDFCKETRFLSVNSNRKMSTSVSLVSYHGNNMSFTEFVLFGRIIPHEFYSLYTGSRRSRTDLYLFFEKTLEKQPPICAFFLLSFVLFCLSCDIVAFSLGYSTFILRGIQSVQLQPVCGPGQWIWQSAAGMY